MSSSSTAALVQCNQPNNKDEVNEIDSMLKHLYDKLGVIDPSDSNQFISYTEIYDLLIVLHDELTCNPVLKRDKYLSDYSDRLKAKIECIKKYSLRRDSFLFIKLLGKGAFGEVHLVKPKETTPNTDSSSSSNTILFAMKVLSKWEMLKRAESACFKAERDLLVTSALQKCPWIVNLHYAFQDENYLYILMEYCPGGNLLNLLKNSERGRFDEMTARFYLSEIVASIEATHSLGYIHRDIKPDNVLIKANGHICLADFGSCVAVPESGLVSSTVAVGTPDYISKEVLASIQNQDGSQYGREADLWSIGIILYELLTGVTPFYHDTLAGTYDKIQNCETSLEFPEDIFISNNAKDLIRKLCIDRDKRLNLSQIKAHAFFHGVKWDSLLNSSNVSSTILKGVIKSSSAEQQANNAQQLDEEEEEETNNVLSATKPKPSNPNSFNGLQMPFIGYSCFLNPVKLNDVDVSHQGKLSNAAAATTTTIQAVSTTTTTTIVMQQQQQQLPQPPSVSEEEYLILKSLLKEAQISETMLKSEIRRLNKKISEFSNNTNNNSNSSKDDVILSSSTSSSELIQSKQKELSDLSHALENMQNSLKEEKLKTENLQKEKAALLQRQVEEVQSLKTSHLKELNKERSLYEDLLKEKDILINDLELKVSILPSVSSNNDNNKEKNKNNDSQNDWNISQKYFDTKVLCKTLQSTLIKLDEENKSLKSKLSSTTKTAVSTPAKIQDEKLKANPSFSQSLTSASLIESHKIALLKSQYEAEKQLVLTLKENVDVLKTELEKYKKKQGHAVFSWLKKNHNNNSNGNNSMQQKQNNSNNSINPSNNNSDTIANFSLKIKEFQDASKKLQNDLQTEISAKLFLESTAQQYKVERDELQKEVVDLKKKLRKLGLSAGCAASLSSSSQLSIGRSSILLWKRNSTVASRKSLTVKAAASKKIHPSATATNLFANDVDFESDNKH